MAINRWIGDALAVAQVDWFTPGEISKLDVFTATINGKTILVTADDDATQSTRTGVAITALAAAINASLIPEFAELTAVAGGANDAAEPTKLIVTGEIVDGESGKPFTLAIAVAHYAPTIEILQIQEGGGGVNEIQMVRLNDDPNVAGILPTPAIFRIEYDGQADSSVDPDSTASEFELVLEGLSNIGVGDATVTGDAASGWIVEFTGALANTNVVLMTGTTTGLIDNSQTPVIVKTSRVSATGPNHLDEPENWSLGLIPVATDDVIYEDSASSCLYELNAISSVAIDTLTIRQSYTGNIGLPAHTGLYKEYRLRNLAITSGGSLPVNIGEGDGSGSARIRIHGNATYTVYDSGTSDDSLPAIQLSGSGQTKATVYKGHVGLGNDESYISTFVELTMGFRDSVESDAIVTVLEKVALGDVVKTGGVLTTQGTSGTPISSILQTAGDTTIGATDDVTSLILRGGTIFYNTTGTLAGAPVVSGSGVLDFTRDSRAKTVTNPVEVFGDDATVNDPDQVVTGLIVDYNETTRMDNLGLNIRVTRGTPA